MSWGLVVGKLGVSDDAGRGAVERLVNLTEHDVTLVSWPHAADAGTSPSLLTTVLDGRVARIDDVAARTGTNWLVLGSSLVSATMMRRSGRVEGLPARQPGTRFIVSRLTALAVRDRADLVFPLGEIRDGDGRITAVRGLGLFRSRWDLRSRLWDRRIAARERKARSPLKNSQWTAVLFVAASSLLSGTIGLAPGALDNSKTSGWKVTWASWTWWLAIVSLVLGLAALGWAVWRWGQNQAILAERRTAYVIDEQGALWQHEDNTSILADISAGFAATLVVPGPGDLGLDWQWQWQWQVSGPRAVLWDARVDDLVSSFWAVHHNDSKVTRNAVFVWAPWPVAMAFGARATSRGRGLVLHVRQRPSYGAGGPHPQPLITASAHDFLRNERLQPLGVAAPQHRPAVSEQYLSLTFHTASDPAGPGPAAPPGPTGGTGDGTIGHVVLLVVRVSHGPVGPIQEDLAATKPFIVEFCSSLAGAAGPVGPHTVRVVEWRLDTLDAEAGQVPDLPWEAFPAAAEAIADWVTKETAANQIVLLATRIPQELAVGLGVQLGQRSWQRAEKERWPGRVYPVVYDQGRLVVPDLALGSGRATGFRA